MSKLKQSLLSLAATGSLGRAISFVKRAGTTIAEKRPVPKDAKSSAQLAWRHMYTKCSLLWHDLSAAEKQEWESAARPRHMTGYAWFISQCLRPNPGIYLPLQGGTMQGNIDMATHRILDLPLPDAVQEPARKKDLSAHATKSTIVHGLGALHAAGFHSAGQAVSKIIWKDASVQVLADLNRVATLDWTDLDLTAATSANAKFVILAIRQGLDSITAPSYTYLQVRKNGTTPNFLPFIVLGTSLGDITGADTGEILTLGLDAGQVIEYKIIVIGTIQVDTHIHVIGYIE